MEKKETLILLLLGGGIAAYALTRKKPQVSGGPIIDTGDGGGGEPQPVAGCTDPTALNYDVLAELDDGSCVYDSITEVYGCTDPNASNYEPTATLDDGSCLYTSAEVPYEEIYEDNVPNPLAWYTLQALGQPVAEPCSAYTELINYLGSSSNGTGTAGLLTLLSNIEPTGNSATYINESLQAITGELGLGVYNPATGNPLAQYTSYPSCVPPDDSFENFNAFQTFLVTDWGLQTDTDPCGVWVYVQNIVPQFFLAEPAVGAQFLATAISLKFNVPPPWTPLKQINYTYMDYFPYESIDCEQPPTQGG